MTEIINIIRDWSAYIGIIYVISVYIVVINLIIMKKSSPRILGIAQSKGVFSSSPYMEALWKECEMDSVAYYKKTAIPLVLFITYFYVILNSSNLGAMSVGLSIVYLIVTSWVAMSDKYNHEENGFHNFLSSLRLFGNPIAIVLVQICSTFTLVLTIVDIISSSIK